MTGPATAALTIGRLTKADRAWAREVDDALRAIATEKRRALAARLFHTTALTVIGVTVPDLRKIVRARRDDQKNDPPKAVLKRARALLDQRTFEGRQVAFEVVAAHPPTMAALTPALLEDLGAGNDNWASVDVFAKDVVGKLWKQGVLRDRDLNRWARSPDRWWRRTVLASTVSLHDAKGTQNADRTIEVCTMLVADRDDMVVKALSWSLRTLCRRDPDAVRIFVDEYESELAKRVVREVTRQLDTGYKTPAHRRSPRRVGKAKSPGQG